MAGELDAFFLSFAGALDRLRAAVLRVTLANATLRLVFAHRAYRLSLLYLVSVFLSLILSLFFPLWVLLIGPFVYGIPHLVSSLRYVHYSLELDQRKSARKLRDARAIRFFSGVFVFVATFRILVDFGYLSWASVPFGFMGIEILSLVFSFLGGAWIYRQVGACRLQGILFALPIVLAAWWMPLWTTGVLILLHNWVGFVFWFRASSSKAEKRVALFATALFSLIHLLLFLGFFDGLYRFYTPAAEVRWAGLDYSELGRAIAPWSKNYQVWFHCVVAYAFGQSVHYFVWLKAIPDQHHAHQVPTSFRQSYRLLIADFGRKYFLAVLGLMGVLAWALAFLRYPQARVLYFSLASYHGFLEFAGLSLALGTVRVWRTNLGKSASPVAVQA